LLRVLIKNRITIEWKALDLPIPQMRIV